MRGFLKLSAIIDAINTVIGKATIWLILIVVVISAGNATLRYTIGWSDNWLLEVQWYLFSAIFLLCGGYVFLKNEHIRIDIIVGRFSPKTQNWIDVFGILVFLLPAMLITAKLSWDVFINAWDSGEVSPNAGGLIRWPVRMLLPIGCALLALQGVSELIKRLAFIFGAGPDTLEKSNAHNPEIELAEQILAEREAKLAAAGVTK